MKSKKTLNQIYLVLFMAACGFFLNHYGVLSFDKIQSFAKSNLNIRYISQIYQGDILNVLGKDIGVSQTSGINVKKVVENEQNLFVTTIGEKVECPIEGLIVKKTNNSFVIQGIDNNEYLFYDLEKVNVSLYQYVNNGKVVGTSKKGNSENYYQVCFNKGSKKSIYECLYYIVNYEEA